MATKWDVNQTPATLPLTIWQLLAQLFAAGWTQRGSGDNTTFSNATATTTTAAVALPQASIGVTSTTGFSAAGVATITTDAGLQRVSYTGLSGGNTLTGCTGGTGNTTIGGLAVAGGPVQSGLTGTGGLDNANSWIRVACPAMTYGGVSTTRELVFQIGSSGSTYLWLRYAPNVADGDGFTVGASASAAPTATVQVNLFGTASSGTQMFGGALGRRVHVMAQDAAPYGFYLIAHWVGGIVDGSGVGSIVIMMDPIVQASSSDKDPYAFYVRGAYPASLDEVFKSDFYANGPSQFTQPLALFSTTVATANYLPVHGVFYTAANTTPSNGQFPVDPYSGHDWTMPFLYARNSGLASPNGPKGFSTFMSWCPVPRVVGDLLSVASPGANDRIRYGHFCLPWNGSQAWV